MDAPAEPVRICPRAKFALLIALVAVALAVYGALGSEMQLAGSRLNAARGGAGAEFSQSSEVVRTTVAIVAYKLPFVLGLVAGLLGSRATRLLEHHPEDRLGHLAAVFAVMLGGLAAVVSGCMLLAVYGWQHVPAYYTA
jgi:hypothetical protein